MTDKSTTITSTMAKTEYLHQRIDSDLKRAAAIVAEQRYGYNSLTTLITAMLLADPAIKIEYNRQKEAGTITDALTEEQK